MTASRDPDRLIHQFLLEGTELLQDPVYEAVRSEIEQQRQRVVVGPWRMPAMNKFLPIGLMVAAAVVALVVGPRLLGPPASSGIGGVPSVQPSAVPSASVVPVSAAPSAADPSASSDGRLPQGPYVLRHPKGGPPVAVTIPAPGWYGEPEFGLILKNQNSDPPDGAAIIGPYFGDLYVYGDPCRWSSTTPKTPATTVEQAVAALRAQASRDASAPVEITVDGHAGKSVTLHVPADTVDSACDRGQFASWAGGGDHLSTGPARYHQGPGQIDELWILDVDGQLIVIDAMYGPETPAGDLAELRAILGSMTFPE